jgi:hypothetical protein
LEFALGFEPILHVTAVLASSGLVPLIRAPRNLIGFKLGLIEPRQLARALFITSR